MRLSILAAVLLTAIPSLSIPSPFHANAISPAKRQTDPAPANACTDLCTQDPDIIEICSSDSPRRVCTNFMNFSGNEVVAGEDFCLNVQSARTPDNEVQSGAAVLIRGGSITAGRDININIIDRNPNGLVLLIVEDLTLEAGGQIRINFGDGPRCIGDNCRVIVQARNVRWRSALTGGQQRLAIDQVYYSGVDGALTWQ